METQTEVKLFGNVIPPGQVRRGEKILRKMEKKFNYRAEESYTLSAADNRTLGRFFTLKNVTPDMPGEPLDEEKGVIIGTIRMGYGHYRIGLALASAAAAMGYTPYWFDLLAFNAPGAKMIEYIDKWYSIGSRLSQKSALFNRFVWDPLFGKAGRLLERNYPMMHASKILSNLYGTVPHSIPVVGTHPWTALGALYAGHPNVVNVIPDNCPLGFHLAEGSYHTVQSPSAYFRLRSMAAMGRKGQRMQGMSTDELAYAGHYLDHELVANIEDDCAARIARLERKEPRRLLVSVGGAGAQFPLFLSLVRHSLPLAKAGKAAVFFNFGDHEKVWTALCKECPEFRDKVTLHTDWEETIAFAQAAATGTVTGIHAFLHKDIFAAVYATNLLMRVSDVLLTKPSELAFYPIPKLFLQRVGGHEAWGAIRGSEIGDGTVECEDAAQATQAMDLFVNEDDLMRLHCSQILKLKEEGVYNGAYKAIEWAMERKKKV